MTEAGCPAGLETAESYSALAANQLETEEEEEEESNTGSEREGQSGLAFPAQAEPVVGSVVTEWRRREREK